MNQTVRIIGGQYRGKKLTFPVIEGLRPTPNRIRETLFNWLMHHIRGARCLDAFAGSGALGFEAFSRGASQVTLVEKSGPCYANLKKLAASFETSCLSVLNQDIQQFLATTPLQFDLIFFDPPFATIDAFVDEKLQTILRVLAPHGLLYLESPRTIDLNPTFWTRLKAKQAGQVAYTLYQKVNEPIDA